jgi:Holliday junction resolvase RusA-like endonuclease
MDTNKGHTHARCVEPSRVIQIDAREHLPVPKGASKERRRDWRRHLVRCGTQAANEAKELGEYSEWLFTVEIEFFLPGDTRTDLDNLSKPVIDALFRPGVQNPNQDMKITGKVFPNADDLQVRQLNLRKTLVQSERKFGAKVTVCWTTREPGWQSN